jgi:hypothetical protein
MGDRDISNLYVLFFVRIGNKYIYFIEKLNIYLLWKNQNLHHIQKMF